MTARKPPENNRTMGRTTGRIWALAGTALVLWLLAQVPYGVLRQERIRAFGERTTRAVVTAVSVDALERRDAPEGAVCSVGYEYLDDLGRVRTGRAWFGPETCASVSPNDVLRVYFAKGDPGLSRAAGEVEPPFQAWLGSLVRGKFEGGWP